MHTLELPVVPVKTSLTFLLCAAVMGTMSNTLALDRHLGAELIRDGMVVQEAAVLDKIQNEVGRLKMDQRQADQKAASWFNWGRKDVKETPSDPIEASQPAVAQ